MTTLMQIFTEEQYNFFKKEYLTLDVTEENLIKNEKHIIELYKTCIHDIKRFVERGFTENYKNINTKELMLFIATMIPKIKRQLKKILARNPPNKKIVEILIGIIFLVIIVLLPIGNVEKGLLLTISKELVPEIADMILNVHLELKKCCSIL